MIVLFQVRLRTIAIAALVVLLLVPNIITHKAHAEALPPEDRRTANWYASHPSFMRQLLVTCRDDPGHGALNPDCVNAKHGEMIEAETQARARLDLPVVLSPADPRYWVAHPDDLPSRLDQCNRFPPGPNDVRGAWCVAARTTAARNAAR